MPLFHCPSKSFLLVPPHLFFLIPSPLPLAMPYPKPVLQVGNLTAPVADWTVGGTALTELMVVERRKGEGEERGTEGI